MGSVEPYETGRGPRYRVRYRDPERRTKAKAGFRTKREAETFLATVSVAVAHGAYIDPGDARQTVGGLGPRWLAAQAHLKPSSYAVLEIAWRVYVGPRWSETEIGRIRHSDVQLWIGQLIAGSAPSVHPQHPLGATSVIRAYGVLAAILDTAVRDRRLSANPSRGVNLPRKRKKRHAYLGHQQVELLAQCAGEEKAPLVRFLCYTGLRWGEATALRVRDVDLPRRRVMVNENAVRVNGRIVVGTPKSHHARSVSLPLFLQREIAAACAGKSVDALVFGDGVSHLNQPTVHGGWFIQAVARARRADPTFPNPTIHDLRHTAASLAVSAGANVKAVQRMLGHASAAMTLDVYADLFDEDLEAVSTALDQARAAEVVQFSRSFPVHEVPRSDRLPRSSRDAGA
ncbi:MAG: site-specific integrase [Actinomycetota bacterium]|nr:site-specific integrase [Actinomycetota bacterium]